MKCAIEKKNLAQLKILCNKFYESNIKVTLCMAHLSITNNVTFTSQNPFSRSPLYYVFYWTFYRYYIKNIQQIFLQGFLALLGLFY